MKKNYTFFTLIVFFIILWSCGSSSEDSNKNNSTSSPIIDVRALEKFQPKDSVLSEKYKRSCFICHSNPDAKAHLVGDKAAWNKLINQKGMALLLTHVNQGFNNMPPKGQCSDCTESDFEALIKFMAEAE